MNLTDRIIAMIIEEAPTTTDEEAVKFLLGVTGDMHQRAITTARKHTPWLLKPRLLTSQSQQEEIFSSFAQEPQRSTVNSNSYGWMFKAMRSFFLTKFRRTA